MIRENFRALTAYYAMLALYLILPQFPPVRLWAFDLWRYLPPFWMWALLGVGIAAPFIFLYLFNRKFSQIASEAEPDTTGRFLIISGSISILLLISFVLLRAKTHFLGDGYSMLTQIASDNPIIKGRNLGAIVTNRFVYGLLAADSPERARSAFQIIAFIGGFAYLGLAILFAVKFLQSFPARLLLFLGMATGGVMLLFFGYVENYALFVSMVLLYVVLGSLAVEKKLSGYWLLLVLPAMISFHIFGVMFIPPTLYLLIRDTKWWKQLSHASAASKLLALVVVAVGSMLVYYYAVNKYIFLRYSVLPILEDRYTVSGYTMFSIDHLLDLLNLLLLLLPGLLVLIAGFPSQIASKINKSGISGFLLTCSAFALLGLILFDPKLGMPRDWDLFSFASIPIILFLFYFLFASSPSEEKVLLPAFLAVILGIITLAPRVYCQVVPEAAIEQVTDYFELDIKKSMQYIKIVQDYSLEHNDADLYKRMGTFFKKNYPEKDLNIQGQELLKQQRYVEAIALFDQAVAINPRLVGALFSKGLCLSYLGRNEEAVEVLNVATGISPYNEKMHAHLAFIQQRLGRFEDALANATRAHELDPTYLLPITTLIQVYKLRRNPDKYVEFLLKGISLPDVSPQMLAEATQYYIGKGDMAAARKTLVDAIAKGLDSNSVAQLRSRIR